MVSMFTLKIPTIMDKSLGTLSRFWGVFQFTQVQPLPLPNRQCWKRVSSFEIQLCIGWGEGGRTTTRKFRKGCTVLRGNIEMTEKYEYCSTVPRTFVQDCRSLGYRDVPGKNPASLIYKHTDRCYRVLPPPPQPRSEKSETAGEGLAARTLRKGESYTHTK